MWHAARQQEKKIKELMVDHKKRAERRKAYYESKLGDPNQLLRLTGNAIKLHPDAEQHYYYENSDKSLMLWQGDNETRIDRFDGRALLDYLPPDNVNILNMPTDERDFQEELNFERFRDLVENERRNVTEDECLEDIEADWSSLLERHKAMMKKLQEKPEVSNKFGYNYESEKQELIASEDEEELSLIDEEDILDYVDKLNDKERQILNEMGKKYNIPDYTRLLRVAKRDREEKVQELKENQKVRERKSRRHPHRNKKDRQKDKSHTTNRSYSVRDSPNYEPYMESDSYSSSSSDEDRRNEIESNDNFVIEFGNSDNIDDADSSQSLRQNETNLGKGDDGNSSCSTQIKRGSSSVTRKKETSPKSQKLATGTASNNEKLPIKTLTPAEKLRLKLQMGLNKQIQVDEEKKLQKERKQKIEHLGGDVDFELTKLERESLSRSRQIHYNKSRVPRERSPSHSHARSSTNSREQEPFPKSRRDRSSSRESRSYSRKRRHSYSSSSSGNRSGSRQRSRSRDFENRNRTSYRRRK